MYTHHYISWLVIWNLAFESHLEYVQFEMRGPNGHCQWHQTAQPRRWTMFPSIYLWTTLLAEPWHEWPERKKPWESWEMKWALKCHLSFFVVFSGPFCHVLSQCGAPGDNGCNVLDGCLSGKGFHHCDHHVTALHVPLLMLSWFDMISMSAWKKNMLFSGTPGMILIILILFLFLIFGMAGSTSRWILSEDLRACNL